MSYMRQETETTLLLGVTFHISVTIIPFCSSVMLFSSTYRVIRKANLTEMQKKLAAVAT